MKTRNRKELLREIDELRTRLEETEETLRAIRAGEVDALIVDGKKGEQVYTLQGADHSYRILMETMNEGAATLTGNGTILYGNGRLASLLKKSLHDLIGSLLPQFVAPAASRTFTKLLKQGRKGHSSGEIALQRADGASVPVQISLSPVDMGGTKVISLVATDLTNLKQAEEALRHANNVLEERVRERTAKLSRANAALRAEIRERRKAEEALRERESILTHALDAGEMGLWGLDVKTRNAWRLPRHDQIFGYESLLPEWTYEMFLNHVLPEDRKEVDEKLKRALSEGIVWSFECRIRRTDGAIRRIWAQGKPRLNAQKEVVQLIGLVRDVTERERREQELHRLNRTLKAHSHSDQAMMFSIDELKYMEEVCKIVAEDCGHAMVWIGFAEDDEAKTVRPVAYAGFDEGYLETLKITWADTERGRGPTGIAIRTGQPSLCRNMLTDPLFAPWREEARKRGYASSVVLPLMADGKAFGAMSIYSREPDPFSEDEVKLLSELGDDLAYGITALRLRAAHAKSTVEAEEGKRILDALMKYIPEGITIADAPDLKIRMVSRYGHEMLGGRHDGMTAEKVAEQWTVYQSDGITPMPHEDLPLARAICKGEIVKNEELVQINAEGKPLNLLCNAAPLYDGRGHIMGGIVAWRDITEIKLAQQEVRRTARELARSNQDLEQFAYVASHDLKEPLRMVKGFMGLLKSRYQSVLDAKANEYIRFAADAAMRMQDLIDALLAYSRVGRSGETESIDVAQSVDAALKNLRASIDESGTVITRDSLPTLQMNPVELTQVFQNLIGNAIKFRREGVAPEVHIGAERMSEVRGQESGNRSQGSEVRGQGSGVRSQGTGSLKSEATGPADMTETGVAGQPVAARPPLPDTRTLNPDTWLFSVRDNGIGIKPEFAKKIFMIFQRLHTREEYPGSGVGLAICKKIVERHGGRIWVDSQPGRGSTFYFSIQDNGKDMK